MCVEGFNTTSWNNMEDHCIKVMNASKMQLYIIHAYTGVKHRYFAAAGCKESSVLTQAPRIPPLATSAAEHSAQCNESLC